MLSDMTMSVDEAKDILRETLDSMCSSNSSFQAARAEAGNDMLKYMRIVFPLATKTQMVVLGSHGHAGQGEDLVRFTRLVKELARHDEELSHLNNELRKLVMPPMNIVRVPGMASYTLSDH